MQTVRLLSLFCLLGLSYAGGATDPRTVLIVIAHPDDEISVLPLMAKYKREGFNIVLAIATDGQKGIMPHFKIPEGKTLAEIRKSEAICAAEAIGIKPPIFLEMEDGSLANFKNLPVLKEKIKSVIYSMDPDVIITWGPEGGYGHPDHRIVGAMVSEIFQEGCEHCPDQLLFPGFPKEIPIPTDSLKTFGAKWLATGLHFVQSKFLTYEIFYSDEDLAVARQSFGCHKSQFNDSTMDEIFSILKLAKNKIYLRPFISSSVRKSSSIFK
jgi:LmbE family N-acetylglucosaminyl deacetylase